MAENEEAVESTDEVQLESGTYEIIRNRLLKHGEGLRGGLDKLNGLRKETFGSIETKLLTTERITTKNNCTARDMVAVGERFLFGYNVVLGLRSQIELSDVFAIHSFEDGSFKEQSLDLISDERFEKDFKDLYRYYKSTIFVKFSVIGPYLFMVFRIGKTVSDLKTFKWSINPDGSLTYMDNRSDHEFRFPSQHEFEWKRATRDQFRFGSHPHVSIEDRVFVETVGGDLTIKVEDNTADGGGIYAEPVEDADQTLDDAEYHYALLGNIILIKIKPYQEEKYRYFVYNEKIQQAVRIDAIENACVLLPEDHGIIFSNGYYLQSGEYKTFEGDLGDMIFEKRVASPNGEDTIFVFFTREAGAYLLLSYNMISQEVATPVICHGYSFIEDGRRMQFRAGHDPQKHHAIQVWQTPFVGPNFVPETINDSYLYKIGNREVVRCMAECNEIINLIRREDTYANLYIDIVKRTGDVLDAYFWISDEQACNLAAALSEIKGAATGAIEEFEKVVRIKRSTREEINRVTERTREIVKTIQTRRFDKVDQFVQCLAELRVVRGEIIALNDLRYVDPTQVEALETEVAEYTDTLSNKCVGFLLEENSLVPYEERVEAIRAQIDTVTKVAEAKELGEQVGQCGSELELLIDIVSNLKIDDATQRTAIIDNISSIYSILNQVRAGLKRKSTDLMSVEGKAEFASQMKLLEQAIVNYLDVCDTPEKAEEYLTKVMVQVEELEGRFADFDEFVLQLTEKREEIYTAFESRKVSLIETRNRKADSLMSAAERILKGIQTRAGNLKTISEIHGYFAGDLMIDKVRDIVEQLSGLDDTIRADDIQGRLKSVREDAVRQLKDRQDLFVEGENVIRFGNHSFSVNAQALDLTTVRRNDGMYLHLTGTRFFEEITDEAFLATRDVWNQEIGSEDTEVYRAEYLAYLMLSEVEEDEWVDLDDEAFVDGVRKFMGPRYAEGYVKGVHDHDAALILKAMLQMRRTVGLLRFHTRARALAGIFWHRFDNPARKKILTAKLEALGAMVRAFPDAQASGGYVEELALLVSDFVAETKLFPDNLVSEAAEYLYHILVAGGRPAISPEAAEGFKGFTSLLEQQAHASDFHEALKKVEADTVSYVSLIRDWVQAFMGEDSEYCDEVTALVLTTEFDETAVVDASVNIPLSGFIGSHPAIPDARMELNYNTFMLKLREFAEVKVPRFESCGKLKQQMLEEQREEMRLEEFKPRVLTSFVRNRLIDKVYLPIVGDNLAKQIGVVGEDKRTDLMGVLLLISPPGYGKTTLMEYIANRLGLTFMKINGPALGHGVTSLDPNDAPNAGAREEIEKLNLSFEMGDNVMLYLDDIQHTNPEFLQKFISLCDGQRKVEGVYKGKSRTYDLRGRKFCVIMAGNPYTESGEKFQIPDMLANRADTYNLGDIIGDTRSDFEMSYLENSLTSNSSLQRLASRSQKDVYSIINIAETGNSDGVEFEGNYGPEDLNEFVGVMKKLMRVRDVILKVNLQYISSAAQADAYRTEPPFKLQGSYRNMNRIAEKVLPVMNEAELEGLLHTHYENEAQTLTSGTEANLLKFAELTGNMTAEDTARWKEIKKRFSKNLMLGGASENDPVVQVVGQLANFNDGLEAIREALTDAASKMNVPAAEKEPAINRLELGEKSMAQFVAALEALKQAMPAAPAVPTAARPVAAPVMMAPPKVEIVNKVPHAFSEVLERQFKLMEAWLVPLMSSATKQSEEMVQLRERLDEAIYWYRHLMKKIDTGNQAKSTRKRRTARKKSFETDEKKEE